MSRASDLIERALRLIGAIASGEAASGGELRDGLTALNGMLSSWSTESLLIFESTRESFDFTPGQQSYTVGPTGDWVTTRPIKYTNIGIEVQGTSPYEVPVSIINIDQWAALTVKSTAGSIPLKVYSVGNYPNDTLSFWPVPNVANKAVLYTEKVLTAFSGVGNSVSLPPGYEDALAYNLAIRIAPEFGKQAASEVVAIAQETKGNIKRQNVSPVYMESDAHGLTGRKRTFNYLTGE